MVAEAGCTGKTAESDGGPQVIAGERNQQQEMVLHSHVWGKFQKGTDRVVNTVGLLSVLFLAPDRSPALLPTLANIYQDPRYRLRPRRVLWIYGCCECQMALVKVVSDILKLHFFVCALPDGDG